MDLPEPLSLERLSLVVEPEPPSAFERLLYLFPARYFRFYMLYDRVSGQTCWLPEGFTI